MTHTDARGNYIKDIPVEANANTESDEEEINLENGRVNLTTADDYCYKCMRLTDMDNLLICDHCSQKGCHLYCLKPRLREVPDSPWYCDYCVRDFHLRSLVQLAFKPGEELPPRDRRPDPEATRRPNRGRRRLVRQAESRDGRVDIGEPLMSTQISGGRERSRTQSRRNRRAAESRAQRPTNRNPRRRRRSTSSSQSFKPDDDISLDEAEERISKLLSSPNGVSSQEEIPDTPEPVARSNRGRRLRRRQASRSRTRSIPERENEKENVTSPIQKENVMLPRLPEQDSMSNSGDNERTRKVFRRNHGPRDTFEASSNIGSGLEGNQERLFGPGRGNRRSKIIPEEEESQSTSETRVKSNSRRNRRKNKEEETDLENNLPYCGYRSQHLQRASNERNQRANPKPATAANNIGSAMARFQQSVSRGQQQRGRSYRPLFSEYQSITQPLSNPFIHG